ncbi:hypothetical protein MMC12_008468 [Toensbergia leucococca]|nr:hypothetical protein [Toensbergia leucococca]
MRPSDERILHDGAHFLNIANQRLEPRLAVIFLAQAGWNYDMAVREYIEQRYSDDEPSLEVGDTAAIPEPEGEASEDERRGEEEEGPDDESEGPQSLATLNQDIDRGHVIKDRRDDSKLVIRIKNLGGLPDSIHKYGKKPRDVDWSDPAAIRAINRWRSQLFRRTLQSNVRGERFSFLEEERRFLLDAHIEYQEKSLAAGAKNVDWKKFDWTRLTKEFNQKFKGQILPTSSKPRPARTKASLLTERSRLEEITDMTGGFKRKDRKAPKAQRPRSVHESDEEDSEEETQGPNRGRRGDPPPGKPPRRRKDGDDDGAGGAGLASSVGRRRELQV